MTTITTDNAVVTLINVFTVEPQQQQRLVDLLVTATETVIGRQPGFVSANIHKSLDGTRVANDAQWRSREDFEAMLTNPEAAAHMRQAAKIATFDAHLYEIAFIDHASWHCQGSAASSAGSLDRLPARQGSPADPLIASPALAPSRIGKGHMTTITTDNEVVTLIVDAACRDLMHALLASGHACSIVTRDPALLGQAHAFIQEHGPNGQAVEFEMLYGITPERLQAMRDRGYRTRIYLPYGREWYLYLCHRLAEYPPNIYQAIVDAVAIAGRPL